MRILNKYPQKIFPSLYMCFVKSENYLTAFNILFSYIIEITHFYHGRALSCESTQALHSNHSDCLLNIHIFLTNLKFPNMIYLCLDEHGFYFILFYLIF